MYTYKQYPSISGSGNFDSSGSFDNSGSNFKGDESEETTYGAFSIIMLVTLSIALFLLVLSIFYIIYNEFCNREKIEPIRNRDSIKNLQSKVV